MNKPTLGVAINCQNEEQHMPATIAQFYHVADEIVVIDGGSTDDSVFWAKKMGARVFHQPWVNNHAFQKNLGASKLNTDWIYIHDPDERLDPSLLEIMPLLLTPQGQQELMKLNLLAIHGAEDFYDCFGIARKNYLDGVQTDIYPDYQYRLWRNNCYYSRAPKDRVHVEILGFIKRTEIDTLNPGPKKTLESPARFNIHHYKTAEMQKIHDVTFDKVEAGELGEIYPEDTSREL